ncbi:hypothetical protein CVU75_01190 [Candidatus Dependentiae bacterium HGW-Dependentiae-1]|nr:MAG: hypothetical protein CVU75_01190 [Candidatus Dependentiae bacterium HGW-Dependentiae-1]
MKFAGKLYRLFFVGLLVASGGASAMSGQLLLHTVMQNYLQLFAKNMGIKGQVILASLQLSYQEDGAMYTGLQKANRKEKLFFYSSAQATKLAKKLSFIHPVFLTASPWHEWHTVAIMQHELGHAKYYEEHPEKNPNFVSAATKLVEKALPRCHVKTHYKDLYMAELFADAAIPNKKELLLASRDHFKLLAEIEIFDDFYFSSENSIQKLVSWRDKLNFSCPMDEHLAQELEAWHYKNNQYYPSAYRRAYTFDARLKALEAGDSVQETELSRCNDTLFEGLVMELRKARGLEFSVPTYIHYC